MTPVISDGKYKLTNVANTERALDLYAGEPLGLITAYTSGSATNQQWNVLNVNPATDNQIILGSVSTPGTYATAYNENKGSGVGGTGNATVWTVVPVGSNYHLKVRTGPLLRAPGDGSNLPVVLDTNTDRTAQWIITTLSSPVIPNGKYKITNVANPKQALDLYAGEPLGLITAYTSNPATNQQWNVFNVNPTSNNEIILGSVSTPGTYAAVYNENKGSGVGGSGNATVWTVVPVGSNYHLKVRTGQLLRASGDGSNLPVVLDTDTDGTAQWIITTLSSPVIPNGKYKITNVAKPKQALDLYAGEPLGLITAYTSNPATNQQWNVFNVNPTSNNEIILGSVSTPGTYAAVYNENKGSGIGGSGNATVWTVVPVGSNYHLKARTGQLLRASGDGFNLPVVLDTDTDGTAQWIITRV